MSSIYAFSTPITHAQEITTEQKAQVFLNNVLGIDTTKYTTTATEFPQEQYLGVVPQKNIQVNLQSKTTNIQMLCTFTNGSLRLINVLENSGTPTIRKTTELLDKAKTFLYNYQSSTHDAIYGNFASMLTDIDASKNTTIVLGTVRLNTELSADSATFRWTYTYNGIEAPVKCMALSYSDGFLKYFVDNWNLYTIGSTSINLSEKEAVADGLSSAKTFSWSIGSGTNTSIIRDFNATQAMLWETIFSNSASEDTARNHDPLTLYPTRHLWVSLDNFYPGNVYGIDVFYWADTKDLYFMRERSTTIDPQQLNATTTVAEKTDSDLISSALITVPALGCFAFFASFFWLIRRNVFRPKVLKIGSLLLCALLILCMVFLPIPRVSAAEGKTVVWGSRSSGAYDEDLGATWRKTSSELTAQNQIASTIDYLFSTYGGYDTTDNNQGPNSQKVDILADIEDGQQNYPFTAVVDFDHGVGNNFPYSYSPWHYMIEDDTGTYVTNHYTNGPPNAPENGVHDYEIFAKTGSWTSESKVYFAYISTCMSANLTYLTEENTQPDGLEFGMPFAWTHRLAEWLYTYGFNTETYMSLFGYSQPDLGHYCYIGFPAGSAGLSQHEIQDGYPQYSYGEFVEAFFYYALQYDCSVRDALDEASLMLFERVFWQTQLYQSFDAIWPMWNPEYGWHVDPENIGHGSTLAVYGNGYMHLRAPELTVYSNVPADVYVDGQYRGVTNDTFKISQGFHTVYVYSATNILHYFAGYGDLQNPVPIGYILSGGSYMLTANFYNNPPPTYTLTVSADTGGTTDPSPGTYGPMTPQFVTLTAVPDEQNGYDFYCWTDSNGNFYSDQAQISVPLSANYDLVAHFRRGLGVQAFLWPDSSMPVDVDIDYSYAGTTDFTVDLSPGTHVITVPPLWNNYPLWFMLLDGEPIYSQYEFEFTFSGGYHTLQIFYVTG
jgi:hypothetical protein